MASVNRRTRVVQATVVNGVNAGGAVSASIVKGYDVEIRSTPDGLQVPVTDKTTQFCRGVIATQDITTVLGILAGTIGTLVFHEKQSGSNQYIRHTITNPVIHKIAISVSKDGHATSTFAFECKAADETKGFADMHIIARDQDEPTYVAANRGGHRVKTCTLGAVNIYHVLSFSFNLELGLFIRSNDLDVGYTTVDATTDGIVPAGDFTFEDSGGETTQDLAAQILTLGRSTLAARLAMAQAATDKVITIAGVDIQTCNQSSGADATTWDASYEVTNNATTQLTIAGTNKIITIEDYAA